MSDLKLANFCAALPDKSVNPLTFEIQYGSIYRVKRSFAVPSLADVFAGVFGIRLVGCYRR